MRDYLQELRKFFKKGDMVLLILCLATSAFGCLVIASATNAAKFGGSTRYIIIQIAATLLGLLCYALMSSVDADFFSEHRTALVIFNVGLLLLLMTPFNATATDERTTYFVNTYTELYGTETLNQFAADGYDCIWAIYEACVAAGITPETSHEGACEALIAQFTGGLCIDGLTGSGMTWQTNGEVSKDAMVVKVVNGAYVQQ